MSRRVHTSHKAASPRVRHDSKGGKVAKTAKDRPRSKRADVDDDVDETESVIVEEEPDSALLEKLRRNLRSHDESEWPPCKGRGAFHCRLY